MIWRLTNLAIEEFGVVKIFPDATDIKFYKLKIGQWGSDSGDRDHFNGRTYGSCPDNDKNILENLLFRQNGKKVIGNMSTRSNSYLY